LNPLTDIPRKPFAGPDPQEEIRSGLFLLYISFISPGVSAFKMMAARRSVHVQPDYGPDYEYPRTITHGALEPARRYGEK
jgi:hypothetical protein